MYKEIFLNSNEYTPNWEMWFKTVKIADMY